MTVAMAVPLPGDKPSAQLERVSPIRLWAGTSANLAYGFMMADQGMLLAPLEAEHLFGEQASLGLALMAICCGVSQLSGPAAGRWSDRYQSSFGRRRPCLMLAMVSVWFLTGVLTVTSDMKLRTSFLFTFLLQQLAWNCITTVQAGLVPDVVAPDQRAAAGGAAAANTLVGAFLALLGVRFLGGLGIHAHYAMTVCVGTVCCTLVCLAANEKPTNTVLDMSPEFYDPISFVSHIQGCYAFDYERHPQFAKLLLSKTLYCSSVMVKGFLLFFIQDTFKLRNAKREQAIVGDTAVAAEAMAALAAVAAMAALDAVSADSRSGRRQQDTAIPPVVEGSASSTDVSLGSLPGALSAIMARKSAAAGAAWMSLMWFGPSLVGLGMLHDVQLLQRSQMPIDRNQLAVEWSGYMVLGTTIWGIGQGMYLAGDQALSYALLPDPDEASRLLGLTSVCSAVGAVFGGSATGLLLYVFGAEQDKMNNHQFSVGEAAAPGYAYPGYAAMFLLASFFAGASSLVLQRIRTVGELSGEEMRIAGPK